jgi:uncharacterized membrane protein
MNKKTTDIFAYCSIVGWLIAFFAGTKEESKFHLNQGLILGIAGTVAACIPCLGWIAEIGVIVLMVMGIIAAAKDEEKVLPVIGGIKLLK